MYFIEPSEKTVADAVGNENCSTGKQHKRPTAEHEASSGVRPVAHSFKGDFFKKLLLFLFLQ